MSVYNSTIQINASLEKVFNTISKPGEFSNAIPHILEVEFLSDIREGVGTKFKETRLMNKRKASTILEVTEFTNNESIRLVSKAGGTTWDSLFQVKPEDDHVTLSLEMKAIPHNIFARMMNRFIKGMLEKALNDDLKSVKGYCENQNS